MNLLRRLLYILPATKFQIAQIILLFIFASSLEVFGIGIIGPFLGLAINPGQLNDYAILRTLYDSTNIDSEANFIALIGLGVILIFLLKSFFAWYTQAHIARFSDEQQKQIIDKMIAGYLEAPYIYHTQKNTASIVDTVIEVANTFTLGTLNPLLTSIANMFVMVALLILLFSASRIMMLVLLIMFLPVLLMLNLFKERVQNWGKTTRQSKENIIRIINHSFGGVKETKVIGCEEYFKSQIKLHTKNLRDSHSHFVSFKILPRFLVESMMVLTVVAIIVSFLIIGRDTQELIPVLGVYALASIRILPAISNTLTGLAILKNSSFTVNQIFSDIVELERLNTEFKGSKHLFASRGMTSYCAELSPSFTKAITVEGVSYSYPSSSRYSVEDISFTICKGDSIAFIGKSGAGKTTLVDLLLGLLVPQEGDILLDGKSIYGNLEAWQKIVGYIPQSIFLTDDTLEKNIAFGVEDSYINHEKLWQAIELAQLSEVVEQLPNGINTLVGERGILLSGGQRQRVGIARALYRESEILVLDEATAALDNDTEKLIAKAINSLSGQKTIITIAHRLSTVEECDRIYRLEHGKIVEQGSYDEVVLRKASA